MRRLFFIFLGIFLATPTHAEQTDISARPSCTRQRDSDPVIYGNEFHWSYTLKEMAAKYEEMYQSSKRLKARAYFDAAAGGYVIEFLTPKAAKKIKLPERFIRNVTKHVEIALARRYADFVFFPDMGHSHFYYPKSWDDELKKGDDQALRYERMFKNPDLKVLYHTAEQLQMRKNKESSELIDDKEIQWRYYTRNPVGDNYTGENVAIHFAWGDEYNTVRELEGQASWSAGFNISANKDACFPFQYKGKTYYFDLSLEDLPYRDGEVGY